MAALGQKDTFRFSSVRWKDWAPGLCLMALVLAAYFPAWRGAPVWDDATYLTSPELRPLDGLKRIWTVPGTTAQYYPLVYTAFWIEHRLWGDATMGYHLLNILLHGLSAVLLWRILRQLEIPGAWLGAAVFALHPVEAESVAWMAELKNAMSGAFYFGAALAYLQYDAGRRRRQYGLALGLFVLGLMSKTAIMTLPAALLVVFWWRRGALNWERDVLPLAPFFATGIGAGFFTEWIERKFEGAVGSEFNFSVVERILIAGRDLWFYLGKLIWPANLTFIYPRWNVSQSVAWQYLFPAAALLLTAVLIWRRWRGPLAALLFFAGTLFPALGFVNVYAFRYSFVADHFQYLAAVGPMVLAAAGIHLALERAPWGKPFLRPAVCGSLLLTLGILTWRQCGTYKDMETLWTATLERNPDCWLALNDLGAFYYNKGRVDEAIELYRKSLALRPENAETHNNLGAALDHQGQTNDAVAEYERALALRPHFPEAERNLGDILLREGQVDSAIGHFRESIRLRPEIARPHYSLAGALLRKGNVNEAVNEYREALNIHPDDAPGHYALGVLLLQNNRTGEAIDEFQKALALRPQFAEAENNLGYGLLRMGQLDEAIEHLRKALAIRADYAQAHYNLGNALLQKGRLDDAIVEFQSLVALQPDAAEAHAALGKALLQKGNTEAANRQFQLASSLKKSPTQGK